MFNSVKMKMAIVIIGVVQAGVPGHPLQPVNHPRVLALQGCCCWARRVFSRRVGAGGEGGREGLGERGASGAFLRPDGPPAAFPERFRASNRRRSPGCSSVQFWRAGWRRRRCRGPAARVPDLAGRRWRLPLPFGSSKSRGGTTGGRRVPVQGGGGGRGGWNWLCIHAVEHVVRWCASFRACVCSKARFR